MVSAVASATVPQFCVVVRKAYGAGLYAMGGPGFAPDATLALPTARIAVMGPEAAVNAVYANQIAEVERSQGAAARDAFVAEKRREYEEDVDLERLAADLVLDGIVEADELRAELVHRLRYAVAARPRVQRAATVDPAGLSRLSADAVTVIRPRPGRPAEQPLGLGARGAAALTEQGDQVVHLVVEPAGHPDHPVRQPSRRHPPGVRAEALLEEPARCRASIPGVRRSR